MANLILLEHNQIDKKRWDRGIERSLFSSIAAYSWYLDVVSPSWKALVLDDYSIVLPLPVKRKLGFSYVYIPSFTSALGLFSENKIDEKIQNQFLEFLSKEFRLIDLFLRNGSPAPLNKFLREVRFSQVLDLSVAYEKRRKNYSSNHLRNIKKAEQKNLIFEANIDPKVVIALFKDNKGSALNKYSHADYKTLEALLCEIRNQGNGFASAVLKEDGQLLSAAFFISHQDRLIYLKGAVSQAGQDCGAMHFLFDKILSTHSEKISVLDFDGSSVKSVARFNHGFGCVDKEYFFVRLKRLGLFSKMK